VLDSAGQLSIARETIADAKRALKQARFGGLRGWIRRWRLLRRLARVEQQLPFVEKKDEWIGRRPPFSLLGPDSRQLRGRDRRRWESGVRKANEQHHKRQVRRLRRRVRRLKATVDKVLRASKSADRPSS
jgi:hypothetical protein